MITGIKRDEVPDGKTALGWGMMLCLMPMLIATALYLQFDPGYTLIIGLLLFGMLFAVNSSVHSYLIIAYAKEDGVSLDVGFYYMANAAGRLFGTILSGTIYQAFGLPACLLGATLLVCTASMISVSLPRTGKREADIHVK
jgi:predicted MFS family arabinose efflux permease